MRAILCLLTITLLTSTCLAEQLDAGKQVSTDIGNAPELRSPHQDSKGRSGHWWWPKLPVRGAKDAAITGNQGRVFGKRTVETSGKQPVPTDPSAQISENMIVCGPRIVLNNILFAFNSVQLSNDGKREADTIIREMSKFPNDTAVCVGHTDDVGTDTENQQLGLRRAQAVVDYMIHSGIEPNRLRAESKGESEPAVPNDTPANRAINRRVVFEVTLRN